LTSLWGNNIRLPDCWQQFTVFVEETKGLERSREWTGRHGDYRGCGAGAETVALLLAAGGRDGEDVGDELIALGTVFA
jgi:hypothetical protein